jgi:hypothetical protein
METTPREAAQALLQLRDSQRLAACYSSNNGVILLAWAAIHLLDMLVFQAGLIAHSVLSAVAGVIVINGLLLLWLIRYRRGLPIHPLRARTWRVIFLWSWYYVALIGVGVGAWSVFIGPFPPGWFVFLGVFGAMPLAVCGYRLYQQAHV